MARSGSPMGPARRFCKVKKECTENVKSEVDMQAAKPEVRVKTRQKECLPKLEKVGGQEFSDEDPYAGVTEVVYGTSEEAAGQHTKLEQVEEQGFAEEDPFEGATEMIDGTSSEEESETGHAHTPVTGDNATSDQHRQRHIDHYVRRFDQPRSIP